MAREKYSMEDTKRKFVRREASWNWEDYVNDKDWFAVTCNLPDEGLIPSEIPSHTVSPIMLQECFGGRGETGYKMSNCKIIPSSEIKKLVQVVEGQGQQSPFRNLLSTSLAKGIYADRILQLKVNWAAYAHTKHKSQLERAWKRGKPAPCGPPLVRHAICYEPPPPLNWKGSHDAESVEKSFGCQFSPFTNAETETDTPKGSNKTVPAHQKVPSTPRSPSVQEPNSSDPAGRAGDHEAQTQKPLLSVLTPKAIKLEIARMVRLQKRFQDDLSTLKLLLDLVSKNERTELTGMDDAYRQVAEEAGEYFSTVNCGEENSSGGANEKKEEIRESNKVFNAAQEEVSEADLGGTSARTHDKYQTWIRTGCKTETEGKTEGREIHLSPPAAKLVVENRFPGGNETSRPSQSTEKGPVERKNMVQTDTPMPVKKFRRQKILTTDAIPTQNHTKLLRKNKSPPVSDLPQQQFTDIPRKRKPS